MNNFLNINFQIKTDFQILRQNIGLRRLFWKNMQLIFFKALSFPQENTLRKNESLMYFFQESRILDRKT